MGMYHTPGHYSLVKKRDYRSMFIWGALGLVAATLLMAAGIGAFVFFGATAVGAAGGLIAITMAVLLGAGSINLLRNAYKDRQASIQYEEKLARDVGITEKKAIEQVYQKAVDDEKNIDRLVGKIADDVVLSFTPGRQGGNGIQYASKLERLFSSTKITEKELHHFVRQEVVTYVELLRKSSGCKDMPDSQFLEVVHHHISQNWQQISKTMVENFRGDATIPYQGKVQSLIARDSKGNEYIAPKSLTKEVSGNIQTTLGHNIRFTPPLAKPHLEVSVYKRTSDEIARDSKEPEKQRLLSDFDAKKGNPLYQGTSSAPVMAPSVDAFVGASSQRDTSQHL